MRMSEAIDESLLLMLRTVLEPQIPLFLTFPHKGGRNPEAQRRA
jgi:hypothetical protein